MSSHGSARPAAEQTVAVVLSTFRPRHFLGELLASVREQSYPRLSLIVRDDGSGEETFQSVKRSLLAAWPDAVLVKGEHIGAARSFLELLQLVGPSSSYAAFCDQDDVWLPDKVSAAVEALRTIEGPAMYFSSVQLVDERLTPIRVYRRCFKRPAFENALVENVAMGCTVVLNRSAIDLLTSTQPLTIVMHDAWCYLVIAGCGTVVFDPQPRLLYRLHHANAVGARVTTLGELRGRLGRQVHPRMRQLTLRQAKELERLYASELRPTAARTLHKYLESRSSLASRIAYALHGPTYFQRSLDTLLHRFLYAVRLA